jgi:hypothetical protein
MKRHRTNKMLIRSSNELGFPFLLGLEAASVGNKFTIFRSDCYYQLPKRKRSSTTPLWVRQTSQLRTYHLLVESEEEQIIFDSVLCQIAEEKFWRWSVIAIIWIIKFWTCRRYEHKKNAWKFCVRKSEEKTLLLKCGRKWRKMLKQISLKRALPKRW